MTEVTIDHSLQDVIDYFLAHQEEVTKKCHLGEEHFRYPGHDDSMATLGLNSSDELNGTTFSVGCSKCLDIYPTAISIDDVSNAVVECQMKACPFCSSEDISVNWMTEGEWRSYFQASCGGCGCTLGEVDTPNRYTNFYGQRHGNRMELLKIWNTREGNHKKT